MNITPITKEYTKPLNASAIAFGKTNGALKNDKNIFSCDKTIVRSTLNEFSNSRGNYLVDIDLTDIYISNAGLANAKRIQTSRNQTNVNNTLNKNVKNIQFLADTPLCDAYELPKSNKKDNNLQIPFEGAYPQYLIDQDAVEQYEATSYGIQDIANSTYCSFSGSPEPKFVSKLVNFVKKVLPL